MLCRDSGILHVQYTGIVVTLHTERCPNSGGTQARYVQLFCARCLNYPWGGRYHTINRKTVVFMRNLGMQLSTFAITVPTGSCRLVLFLTVLSLPRSTKRDAIRTSVTLKVHSASSNFQRDPVKYSINSALNV